jgi:hypothetical protein
LFLIGRFFKNLLLSNLFRNQQIRNKNCLWQPCLQTDRDEISNLYRGSSFSSSFENCFCRLLTFALWDKLPLVKRFGDVTFALCDKLPFVTKTQYYKLSYESDPNITPKTSTPSSPKHPPSSKQESINRRLDLLITNNNLNVPETLHNDVISPIEESAPPLPPRSYKQPSPPPSPDRLLLR